MPSSNRILTVTFTMFGLLMMSFLPRAYAQTTIPLTGYPYNCNPLLMGGKPHCYGQSEWHKNKYAYSGIQSIDSVRGINGGGLQGYPN